MVRIASEEGRYFDELFKILEGRLTRVEIWRIECCQRRLTREEILIDPDNSGGYSVAKQRSSARSYGLRSRPPAPRKARRFSRSAVSRARPWASVPTRMPNNARL
jgi:hypothetical protein